MIPKSLIKMKVKIQNQMTKKMIKKLLRNRGKKRLKRSESLLREMDFKSIMRKRKRKKMIWLISLSKSLR